MKKLVGRQQQGLTLIELMVSITISMLVLAGVFQLYLTASQTQRSQEGVARIQENMRYLFGKLEGDLTQAGYIGCVPMFGSDEGFVLENLLSNKKAGLYDFEKIIEGKDGTGINGSDTMVVHYFSAASQIPFDQEIKPISDVGMESKDSQVELNKDDARYKLLNQYDIVMVSDCSYASVFMITNDPLTSGGILEHDAVTADPDGQSNTSNEFHRAYGKLLPGGGSTAYVFGGGTAALEWKLDTSAAGTAAGALCSAATPQYCALLRDGEELAEGVENMQIQYGWTNGTDKLVIADASGVGDWATVDRVVVTLTLNSIQRAPTLDGKDLTTKEVSKTFMLRNQLPGSL